jgi:hypothetical protein
MQKVVDLFVRMANASPSDLAEAILAGDERRDVRRYVVGRKKSIVKGARRSSARFRL